MVLRSAPSPVSGQGRAQPQEGASLHQGPCLGSSASKAVRPCCPCPLPEPSVFVNPYIYSSSRFKPSLDWRAHPRPLPQSRHPSPGHAWPAPSESPRPGPSQEAWKPRVRYFQKETCTSGLSLSTASPGEAVPQPGPPPGHPEPHDSPRTEAANAGLPGWRGASGTKDMPEADSSWIRAHPTQTMAPNSHTASPQAKEADRPPSSPPRDRHSHAPLS